MIDLKVLPKSWKDIYIKQYIQLYDLKDEYPTDELSDYDYLELKAKTISIITGIPQEELESLDMNTFNQIDEITSFRNTSIPSEVMNLDEVEVDGIKFAFNKNLNERTFRDTMNLEYYINQGMIHNLHSICSVLLKQKEGEKYTGDLVDLFYNKLSIEYANSLALFFCLLGMSFFPSDMVEHSALDKIMMNLKMMNNSLKNQLG